MQGTFVKTADIVTQNIKNLCFSEASIPDGRVKKTNSSTKYNVYYIQYW